MMPVIRRDVSQSMLEELLGIDSGVLLDMEFDRRHSTVTLVLEDVMQTTGTAPTLHDNTIRRKPKRAGGKP